MCSAGLLCLMVENYMRQLASLLVCELLGIFGFLMEKMISGTEYISLYLFHLLHVSTLTCINTANTMPTGQRLRDSVKYFSGVMKLSTLLDPPRVHVGSVIFESSETHHAPWGDVLELINLVY